MSQRVLSDAEFAKQVNAGGASRRISDNRTPVGGYMVSIPTRGLSGSDGSYQPHGEINGVQAHAHKEYLRAMHPQSSALEDLETIHGTHNDYQGGWRDHETGVTHLDRSTRVLHPGLAISTAQRNKQDAIWDNNKGEEIRVEGLDATKYGRRPKH